jgi:Na+-driven multidrug efflux pump
VFILPRFLKLDGVWWSFPSSDLLTFLLTLTFLIPQVRQLRKERKYHEQNENGYAYELNKIMGGH